MHHHNLHDSRNIEGDHGKINVHGLTISNNLSRTISTTKREMQGELGLYFKEKL